ncbi:MAG: amidohydrolase family protein [Planctomycetes bacterium]|nr:amidohydrolase family protein [Planctomycetota bacterium]
MIVDIHAHYGQWPSSSEKDTPERFREALDRFGINASIVSSARAIQYDIISGNAEVADLVNCDDRIYGAIVVNPNHREASLAELSRHGQNERFVAAKLHPDYSGVPADSPLNMAILRRIAQMDMPLLVHTWGAVQVEAASSIARAFPPLRVVMLHMGATAWGQGIQRASEYSNLYVEIAATLAEPARITEAVRRLGAEKVFFGTDMTLLSPAYAVGLVKAAGLTGQENEKVMGGNAKGFFALD